MNEMDEQKAISEAIGRITSGLYVATARVNGEPYGMLASFIEQAAFEPPLISISVGSDRPLRQALDGHGMFGINVLSRQNSKLIGAFSRHDVADPFAGLALVENVFEIPQLADAMAFIVCKVAGKIDAGDHTLYLAEAVDGTLQHPGAEPMIRLRSDGFRY